MFDTTEHLERVGIKYSGAGRNREMAFEPALVELDDFKIAFISFSDHPEEYAASEYRPGIAYIDLHEKGKTQKKRLRL